MSFLKEKAGYKKERCPKCGKKHDHAYHEKEYAQIISVYCARPVIEVEEMELPLD